MSKQEILTAVKDYCASKQQIVAVYAFGSITQERFNQNSDLDLGVMTVPELDKVAAFDLKLTLEAELEKLVDRETDVVIFSQAPLRLKQQIIKGKLIVENDKHLRVKKESRARAQYFDMQYFYQIYEQNLGERIINGR